MFSRSASSFCSSETVFDLDVNLNRIADIENRMSQPGFWDDQESAQQLVTDRNVHDRLGALDGVTFLDVTVRAEDHDTDVVGLEVQRHAHDAARELDHLTGLHVVQAVPPDARESEEGQVHRADPPARLDRRASQSNR